MARIAIVDDFIQDERLRFPVKHYCLEKGGFRQRLTSRSSDMDFTHGTLVAKVLETYARDYELISVQILDNWFTQRGCSADRLIAALDFCTQIGVDAVHCSIGTERLSRIRQIRKPLAVLNEEKIPVIAAVSNAMYRTIPASCSGIFGVMISEKRLLPPGRYAFVEDPYLSIGLAANYELCISENAQFAQSSSLAAPVVTAAVNGLLNSGIEGSFDALTTALKFQAWTDTLPDFWMNRSFRRIESVPVVCLVDILSQDGKGQIELMDIFAQHGYEAVGITGEKTVQDVRLLACANVSNQSPAKIIGRMLASTRTDLLIAFLASADACEWEQAITQDSVVLHPDGSDYDTVPYQVYSKIMKCF